MVGDIRPWGTQNVGTISVMLANGANGADGELCQRTLGVKGWVVTVMCIGSSGVGIASGGAQRSVNHVINRPHFKAAQFNQAYSIRCVCC